MIPCKLCHVNDGQPEICVNCAPATARETKKHSDWCLASRPDGGEIPNCLCSPATLPKWVRITSLNGDPKDQLTGSKVYPVEGWDPELHSLRITGNDGYQRWLSDAGTKPDPMYPTFASWEPASDPSCPRWVPKVGDQVRIKEDYADFCSVKAGTEFVVKEIWTTDRKPEDYEVYGLSTGQYVRVKNLEPSKIAPYIPKVGDVVEFGARTSKSEQGVVVAINADLAGNALYSSANIVMFGEKPTDKPWCRYFFNMRYLRPATTEERIAAGLDIRPELVRILSLPGQGKLPDNDGYMIEVGEVYRVMKWDNRGSPEVSGMDTCQVTLSSKGASIDPDRQYYATWEPA